MRRGCLIGIAVLVGIGLVVVFPYRSEDVVLKVNANPTGCAIDVRIWSDHGYGAFVPVIDTHPLADPVDVQLFVDGCPGVPRGEPAEIILLHGGGARRGESCGDTQPLEHVCRVPVPPALGRYQLTVEVERGKPQRVEVEIRREFEWRSKSFDMLMSI